jgi:hypothetical protein
VRSGDARHLGPGGEREPADLDFVQGFHQDQTRDVPLNSVNPSRDDLLVIDRK